MRNFLLFVNGNFPDRIRKLGGHITLSSKENDGTKITVYIPNERIY
jgi:sensor histidine kinase regulating citrate/malate metabolism